MFASPQTVHTCGQGHRQLLCCSAIPLHQQLIAQLTGDSTVSDITASCHDSEASDGRCLKFLCSLNANISIHPGDRDPDPGEGGAAGPPELGSKLLQPQKDSPLHWRERGLILVCNQAEVNLHEADAGEGHWDWSLPWVPDTVLHYQDLSGLRHCTMKAQAVYTSKLFVWILSGGSFPLSVTCCLYKLGLHESNARSDFAS